MSWMMIDDADYIEMKRELVRLKAREQELLENNTQLVNARRAVDRQGMVRQFMRVFGQPISGVPGELPTAPSLHGFKGDDMIRFRVRLIAEEFVELLSAVFATAPMLGGVLINKLESDLRELVDGATIDLDMPELIDATIDIDYVIEGFRSTLGIDATPLWAEVHRSNMAKAGPDGVPRRRPVDGKVMKPDGWTPPAIAAELRAQGWKG